MSVYIENSGITKTTVETNNKKMENVIKWSGDYDGQIANVDMQIKEDGVTENLSMKLDNKDIMHLLGIQPVNMSLDKRLTDDFLMHDDQPIKKKKLSKKIKHGKRTKKNKKSKKRN